MSGGTLHRLPLGPVLIVADNQAIARSALLWARQLADAGRPYRVRLAGPSGAAVIAAEATSLEAVAILWAGSDAAHHLAASAAESLGLPLLPIDGVVRAVV